MTPAVLRLWLVNAAGNALLLVLMYWWLAIPERRAWQLAASALLGLFIVLATMWLHTATFRLFRITTVNLAQAVPAVLTCVLIGLVLLLVLAWVAMWFPRWSVWIASTLSYRLQRPVRPDTVRPTLEWISWALAWIAIPVFLLPRIGAASASGFRGLIKAPVARRFYLDYLAALLIGAYLPWKFVNWVPGFEGFTAQAISFTLRFGIAWALTITAWLWIARSTAPAKPGFRR